MWPFKEEVMEAEQNPVNPKLKQVVRTEVHETLQAMVYCKDSSVIEGNLYTPFVIQGLRPEAGASKHPWNSARVISAEFQYFGNDDRLPDPTGDLNGKQWIWVNRELCIPIEFIYTIRLERKPITLELIDYVFDSDSTS